MNQTKRQLLLAGLLLSMLALAAGWSARGLSRQRSVTQAEAQTLADCHQLTQNIVRLRQQEALPHDGLQDAHAQEQVLVQKIEAAAATVGLHGQWLQGVDHKPAYRVQNTPYERKPAVIVMRSVSLRQLVTLLYTLTAQTQLTVEDLRLRTPRGQASENLWDAEATLSYLIYSPSPSSGR